MKIQSEQVFSIFSINFLEFCNHKVFHVSDLSLLMSQHLLHHNMAFIIYLSLSIYIQAVYLAADSTGMYSVEYLEMPIERT